MGFDFLDSKISTIQEGRSERLGTYPANISGALGMSHVKSSMHSEISLKPDSKVSELRAPVETDTFA